jgi:hypothetical protein
MMWCTGRILYAVLLPHRLPPAARKMTLLTVDGQVEVQHVAIFSLFFWFCEIQDDDDDYLRLIIISSSLTR